jgi:hypothetical protein
LHRTGHRHDLPCVLPQKHADVAKAFARDGRRRVALTDLDEEMP